MPIYEYCCEECSTRFELLRPFSKADSETPCKICGSTNTRRLLSHVNSSSSDKSSGASSSCGCGSCSGGSCNGCHH